jgi:hypothetical protein
MTDLEHTDSAWYKDACKRNLCYIYSFVQIDIPILLDVRTYGDRLLIVFDKGEIRCFIVVIYNSEVSVIWYRTAEWFMKSVNWPKPCYTSITCSTISNILYNLILTTKFNDSSILITIISCDYLNLSLANEYAV